jgi:hypothetical protein
VSLWLADCTGKCLNIEQVAFKKRIDCDYAKARTAKGENNEVAAKAEQGCSSS